MKVLLFDSTCAFLTPGGKTTHALMLQKEISKLGIEIEFARWWDQSQYDCDIIHFLNPEPYVSSLAKKNGIKTILSLIFDFETSKTPFQQRKTILKNQLLDILPSGFNKNQYWKSFSHIDCFHFMHNFDRDTAMRYFPQISKQQTIVIPHAFSKEDVNLSNNFKCSFDLPKKYLVSCANISERKQSILLARYAKLAQTPIIFIGNSNSSDSYCRKFFEEIDNHYVFYPGYVSREEKHAIESQASGFVLLSKGESGCIAVYEAAAYRLPLFLNKLPWAFGYESPSDIQFCDAENEKLAVSQLKTFFKNATKLDHFPFIIHSWEEIAKIYVEHYRNLLNKL